MTFLFFHPLPISLVFVNCCETFAQIFFVNLALLAVASQMTLDQCWTGLLVLLQIVCLFISSLFHVKTNLFDIEVFFVNFLIDFSFYFFELGFDLYFFSEESLDWSFIDLLSLLWLLLWTIAHTGVLGHLFDLLWMACNWWGLRIFELV